MKENMSGCFFLNTVYKPSYSRFCPKFRCHGNGGHLGVNLDDAVK